MKKLVLGMTMALALTTAAAPTMAFGQYHKHTGFNKFHFIFPFLCDYKDKPKPPTESTAVPEIDAAGAGLALAFVGGILAVRRERRKAKE